MKRRKLAFIAFLTIFFLCTILGMSLMMSDDKSFMGILRFLYDNYDVYFYVIPSAAFVLCYFTCSVKTEFEKEGLKECETIAEVLVFFFVLALSYLFRSRGLFGKLIAEEPLGCFAAVWIRLLLVLLISWLLLISVKRVLSGNYKNPFSFFNKLKYGIVIFTLLFIKMLLNASGDLNYWASVWYVMDYSDGFSSRLLPGTILSLLHGNKFLEERTIYWFVMAALFAIVFMLALMLGKYIDSADTSFKRAALFLTFLYLAAPGNIEFLWTKENMGRIETFVLLFLLPAILLFECIKNKLLKYMLAAVLSVICMACYQGYLFLYFPVLFTVMVYDIFEDKDQRKKALAGCIAVCAVTAASFLYFQFGTVIHYDSLDDIVGVLSQRTDMEIDEGAVYAEYFSNVKNSWYDFFQVMIDDQHDEAIREIGYVTMALILPGIILFVILWKKILSVDADVKYWKSIYFWILLSDLIIIPQFFLTMDWGRWFAAVVNVQFFQLMYLHYKKDKGAEQAMQWMENFVSSHKFICVAILLYFAGLSRFEAAIQTEDARRILRLMNKFL